MLLEVARGDGLATAVNHVFYPTGYLEVAVGTWGTDRAPVIPLRSRPGPNGLDGVAELYLEVIGMDTADVVMAIANHEVAQ